MTKTLNSCAGPFQQPFQQLVQQLQEDAEWIDGFIVGHK